jgi:hypothetical protein
LVYSKNRKLHGTDKVIIPGIKKWKDYEFNPENIEKGKIVERIKY